MIFQEEQQIFDYIKNNEKTPSWITLARDYADMLFALIDGGVNSEKFKDYLISEVEHIENSKKARARKKYARSIKDFFDRLGRPIDNVFQSTGSVRHYENITDTQRDELVSHIDKVRGNKSLIQWIEDVWVQVYRQDPNGIIFLEYDASLGIKPFPTYKSIHSIRNYVPNGQLLELLLFEPKDLEGGAKKWVIVDDVYHYTVVQQREFFTIVDKFEHQFGKVPAVVNSNLEMIGSLQKLSPYDSIIEVAKEYGRDLSVKTIYKFLQGFPKHWRYISTCPSCHGLGKTDGIKCGDCNGTGEMLRGDVTGEDRFVIPESDESVITPGSGYVSPDLDTLDEYRTEITLLQDTMTFTHWGVVIDTQTQATATEIVLNTQPITQRLNKYADVIEGVERTLSNMIANNMFPTKPKDKNVASIGLGRNYILEALGTVLQRYEAAREKGLSASVLDRLYNEYLLSKYKNDNLGLQLAILKSKVEPYIHFTTEQIELTFNKAEAQRKVLFSDWWKSLDNFNQSPEQLKNEFNNYFKSKQVKQDEQTSSNS